MKPLWKGWSVEVRRGNNPNAPWIVADWLTGYRLGQRPCFARRREAIKAWRECYADKSRLGNWEAERRRGLVRVVRVAIYHPEQVTALERIVWDVIRKCSLANYNPLVNLRTIAEDCQKALEELK